MEPVRRGGERAVDTTQTLLQRRAVVAAFSRRGQNRQRARPLPSLGDRGPGVEARRRNPLGMEVAVADQLRLSAHPGSRRDLPRALIETGVEVRIREHFEKRGLVARSRPRREQEHRPGCGGAGSTGPRGGAGQEQRLYREVVANARDPCPGLIGSEAAVGRLRQNLAEQPDVIEPIGLEAGHFDGEARVDQSAGGTVADPDGRTVRGFFVPLGPRLHDGNTAKCRGQMAGRQRDELRARARGSDRIETEPWQRRLPGG